MSTTASRPTSPSATGASTCSLTQALDVVGERWTFLIMREALAGTTRFSAFRSTLRIASDVLTARLNALVEGGIMVRRSYQEPGRRTRASYHLTDAGHDLSLVLGALQQWGDIHRPSDLPRLELRSPQGREVAVCFVDEDGTVIDRAQVHTDQPKT